MNIPDKPRLFGELRRVVRAGGRLAFYEIVAGRGGEVRFPVPWARRPEISFLASPEEVRAAVEQGRFRIMAWRDVTTPALEWFRERAAGLAAGTTPALGLHLLLGPDARQMFANHSASPIFSPTPSGTKSICTVT